LSHKGRGLLVQHFGFSGEEFRVPTKIKNLDHRFAINSFRISLAIAVKETPDLKLGLFRPEWDLKALQIPNLIPLIPDAIFMIQDSRAGSCQEIFYALEVDLGAESPSYWARYKVHHYLEILKAGYPLFFGMKQFTVVSIVPSSRRLRSLARATFRAGGSREFLFAEEGMVNEETILSPIFLHPNETNEAGADDRVALL